MKRLLLLLTAALTLISTAQAHPSGHEGGLIDTARHIVTQPNHIVMMVAALATVAVAVLATKRSRAAKK